MARNLADLFKLTNTENMQRNSVLSSVTKALAFDDLGDFVEERQRIQRKVETLLDASIKIDFSDFSNHVCFDSAVSKFSIAKNKILNQYPFNGNSQDKDLFFISCSLYENYISDQWPKSLGYANFNSSNVYITSSDPTGQLYLGTSSLYVSARVSPAVPSLTTNVLSVVSGSVGSLYGYALYTSTNAITFRILSGVFTRDFTANLTTSLQNNFNTIAAIYDYPTQTVSIYLNSSLQKYATTDVSVPSCATSNISVGTSQYYSNFSGSLDEIRVFYTSSVLYHLKNYNRPVTSENFLKLNYRFNEGITNNPGYDSTVIDYSGYGLHGHVANYSSSFRSLGATSIGDTGDLILYPFHSDVINFTSSIELSASAYDASNRSYIFRLIPDQILQDDQNATGLLTSFSLAMARYFDDLKCYVDQFDNLRITNYDDVNETPDLMLPLLKRYFGWQATDHFSDSNPLQFLFGEDVTTDGTLEVPLIEIKNQFWRRILNNLPYLYKAKGKRDSIYSFFNVLGIDKNLVNLKEYGYLNYNTISDDYISKEKPFSFLGFGIQATGSYVKASNVFSASSNPQWTVELYTQLPYFGNQYVTNSLSGSLWYATNGTQGFGLQWSIPSYGSLSGTITFVGTNGASLSAQYPIFTDKFVHIAAGISSGSQVPFLTVRVLDDIDLSTYSATGSSAFAAPFTSGPYDFYIGTKGALQALGNIGEVRVWSRQLQSAELDAHALNPESVGTQDPFEMPKPLMARWALNENIVTSTSGTLTNITDLSKNNQTAQGYNFASGSYNRVLLDYSFLSPSTDLKWTQNKIRIRNESDLSYQDLGVDTNNVNLEFNLVDALNEDIVKIFSTLESFNNAIGAPVNKYRDEYEQLEGYRRVYFDRLTTSLNFTKFFQLFQWFDQKLATSIKQLLPARANFIGGEFVVESHLLERNRYKYQYPVFHTPKDINTGSITHIAKLNGLTSLTPLSSAKPLMGTYTRYNLNSRNASVLLESTISKQTAISYADGLDWNKVKSLVPQKVSGDQIYEKNHSNSGVNYKNELAKKILNRRLGQNINKHNENIVCPNIGNGFIFNDIQSDEINLQHPKKSIRLVVKGYSYSDNNFGAPSTSFSLSSDDTSNYMTSFVYDSNNVPIDSTMLSLFHMTGSGEKYEPIMSFCVFPFNYNADGTPANPANSGYFDIVLTDKSNNSYPIYFDGNYQLQPDGWFKYTGTLLDGSGGQLIPVFDLIQGGTNEIISWNVYSTINLYALGNFTIQFKDFQLSFNQPLSTYGVAKYKKIDNQNNLKNNIFSYVNRNVLPKSDLSALRAIPYLAWDTKFPPAEKESNALNFENTINGGHATRNISVSKDNTIYINYTSTGIGSPVFGWQWLDPTVHGTYLSQDGGNTFKQLDNDLDYGLRCHLTASNQVFRTVAVSAPFAQYAYDVYGSSNYGLNWTKVLSITASACSLPNIQMDSAGTIFIGDPVTQPRTSSPVNNGTFAKWNLFRSLSNGTSGSFTQLQGVQVCLPKYLSANNRWIGVSQIAGQNLFSYSTDKGNTWDLTGISSATDGTPKALVILHFACHETLPYVYGVGYGLFDNLSYIAISSDGGSSFIAKTLYNDVFTEFPSRVTCDSQGGVYVTGIQTNYQNNNVTSQLPQVAVSYDYGQTFTDSNVTSFTSANPDLAKNCFGVIDLRQMDASCLESRNNKVYVGVQYYSSVNPVGNANLYIGSMMNNFNELGPSSLATSFSYADSQASLLANVKTRLNNISEFPHYGGFFQMRNLVLGTQDKGTIGNTDDYIVQVNHVGSVVEIFWPDQSALSAPVKGFGELSPGQSPGNLTTQFVYGPAIDVTGYDKLTLYCYLQKQISGTLDAISVQVQRRPLTSVGFTTDQLPSYSLSSSFATEALYTDLVNTKNIDYGDLSISSIGYSIDYSLNNVKEVRIGARQKIGQNSPNQNFLVWGRLINSKIET